MRSSLPLRILEIESQGQLILGDLGLIAAMLARAAGQERSHPPVWIAARSFHVNDFGAEVGHLRADIWLRHNDPGADHPNARKGPKGGHDSRCEGPGQVSDPFWDLLLKNLDLLLVLEDALIMCHLFCPPPHLVKERPDTQSPGMPSWLKSSGRDAERGRSYERPLSQMILAMWRVEILLCPPSAKVQLFFPTPWS